MTRRITETAGLLAVAYAARRYYRNWGTTKAECQMRFPGDTLVGDPVIQTTEAVYIDAPSAAVWPELLLGYHEADRVRPERTELAVGDVVRLAPEGWMGLPDGVTLRVAAIEPEKYLVLNATRPGPRWNAVLSFHLLPHWEDRVRLLIRIRVALRHSGEMFAVELARPLIALGTRGLLLEIKRRAERRLPSTRRGRLLKRVGSHGL